MVNSLIWIQVFLFSCLAILFYIMWWMGNREKVHREVLTRAYLFQQVWEGEVGEYYDFRAMKIFGPGLAVFNTLGHISSTATNPKYYEIVKDSKHKVYRWKDKEKDEGYGYVPFSWLEIDKEDYKAMREKVRSIIKELDHGKEEGE